MSVTSLSNSYKEMHNLAKSFYTTRKLNDQWKILPNKGFQSVIILLLFSNENFMPDIFYLL